MGGGRVQAAGMPQHLTNSTVGQPREEQLGGCRCAWGTYRSVETCGLGVSVEVCHVSVSHATCRHMRARTELWGRGMSGVMGCVGT